MKTIILLAAILAVALTTVVPRVTPIHSHVPRTYKVNIDDSPETRWTQILKDYHEPLVKFMNYVDMLPIPASFYNGV